MQIIIHPKEIFVQLFEAEIELHTYSYKPLSSVSVTTPSQSAILFVCLSTWATTTVRPRGPQNEKWYLSVLSKNASESNQYPGDLSTELCLNLKYCCTIDIRWSGSWEALEISCHWLQTWVEFQPSSSTFRSDKQSCFFGRISAAAMIEVVYGAFGALIIAPELK